MEDDYREIERERIKRFKKERNEKDDASYREFLRNMKRYKEGKK